MDRVLTVNEKIILVSAVIQLIALSILIVTLYSSSITVSTYDIWNTIYLFSVALINGIMLLTLFAMIIAGNAGKADRRK